MDTKDENNEVAEALAGAGFSEEATKLKEDVITNSEGTNEEQKQEENAGETIENKQETEKTILTDFEKEQQTKGWNPDGEKSAEEWLRAQPLYEEIKQRGKEIKQLKRTVESMKDVMEKQSKIAYDQAIADLEYKKSTARAIGDNNAAQDIQKQIENTQQQSIVQPDLPQEAYDFAERNASWISGTTFEEMEIAKFARERDNELATRGLDPATHILTLEEHIKKKFPDYFGVNVKPSSQTVESSNSSGTFVNKNKKSYTINDLNPAQKQVIYDFERSGVITKDGARNSMTRESYIKILVDGGELK